jgi:hypothetical protein
VLDAVALPLVLIFVAAGVMLRIAQSRYLDRYRQVHGVDLLGGTRYLAAPWLFFVDYLRLMRRFYAAYAAHQADLELERRRQGMRRWQWVAVSAWALMMLLALLRLAGIA